MGVAHLGSLPLAIKQLEAQLLSWCNAPGRLNDFVSWQGIQIDIDILLVLLEEASDGIVVLQ